MIRITINKWRNVVPFFTFITSVFQMCFKDLKNIYEYKGDTHKND